MAPQSKPKPATGLLIGKKEIARYLNVSNDVFDAFVKLGMPLTVFNKRYYAHQQNLELWFQAVTRRQSSQLEADAE